MHKFDILICNDDELELPVTVVDTLQEASEWLGCKVKTLYNTLHLDGYMHFNGYKVELVRKESIK